MSPALAGVAALLPGPSQRLDGSATVTGASIDFDALRPQLAALCRRYGIAERSVFGSVARGDDRPDSDVDVLYVSDPNTEATWLDRWEMKERLEELTGRRVDLVPKDHLHWVIRDRVLAEAVLEVDYPDLARRYRTDGG